MLPALRGVYLITPDQNDTDALLAATAPLLAAGPALLQYRNKSADAALRLQQARALQALCAQYGVPLLVNDEVALAEAVGAAGVHLGEDDGELAAARARLGTDAIIGASCYNQPGLAVRARDAGASYIAWGAFHPSSTKPLARRADPQLLRDGAALGLPQVAIGGITADNGGVLVQAGADLLAVINGVYAAPDPVAALRACQSLFPKDSR